jgi:toxin ParE1/3/4
MSINRLQYHEGAAGDVRSAVSWYRKKSPKAALDFIDELNRATRIIVESPERWPTGNAGTKRFLLWRFPFTVIYSHHQSEITIWAVAHGSRRPEYWMNRL